MVDAIGWKAAGAVTKVTTAVTSTPVAAAPAQDDAAPKGETATAAAATGIARQMAAGPPVDTDRVARIKAAIAAGKFPILPSTIADRLLALSLNWNSNAQA